MTEMEQKQLAFIHQAVAKMNLSADEYVDTQDGLIHCKNCRKPRLVLLTAMPGRPFAFPRCQCSCQQKELERELQEKERVQKELRISHRRELGLPSQSLQHYTFSQDNGRNPLMRKASAYVKHWEKAYQTHTGLLLFGNVGTGKSFFCRLHRQRPAGQRHSCTDDQLSYFTEQLDRSFRRSKEAR